jgi:hypothetical protein
MSLSSIVDGDLLSFLDGRLVSGVAGMGLLIGGWSDAGWGWE